jgi:hypothetical protein
VHDVLVRHVGIREHDGVDLVLAHELFERRFRQDRDSVRIQRPRQLGGVAASIDVRDLRRGEGDDLVLAAAAVDEVEVVEVAARGACNEYSGSGHE